MTTFNNDTSYTPELNSKYPELIIANKLARLMDEQFRIPGTKFRFGLDPILNFFPVVGDLFTLIISLLIVMMISKYGASRKLVLKMCVNSFFDFAISSIPLVGYVVDFFYKANKRNLTLLNEHYYEGKHQGKGTGYLLMIIAVLFLVGLLFIYLFYLLISWLIHLL